MARQWRLRPKYDDVTRTRLCETTDYMRRTTATRRDDEHATTSHDDMGRRQRACRDWRRCL